VTEPAQGAHHVRHQGRERWNPPQADPYARRRVRAEPCPRPCHAAQARRGPAEGIICSADRLYHLRPRLWRSLPDEQGLRLDCPLPGWVPAGDRHTGDAGKFRWNSVADIAAGMCAFNGVFTALFERERAGLGTYMAVTMLDAYCEWVTESYLYAHYGGVRPSRTGTPIRPSRSTGLIAPETAPRCSSGFRTNQSG